MRLSLSLCCRHDRRRERERRSHRHARMAGWSPTGTLLGRCRASLARRHPCRLGERRQARRDQRRRGGERVRQRARARSGASYVKVSSILNNPNTDPHTFEASTSVAEEVSHAELIVQNGVGYDGFMNDIESASPNPRRKVIVVQHVLGLPDNTPNPAPLVQPEDDAGGGQGDGGGPLRTRPGPQGVLPGETAVLRRLAQALVAAPSPPSRRSTPERRSPQPSPSPTTCSPPWA